MKKLEDILSKAITKRSIFVSSFTWISLNYYHFKKLEDNKLHISYNSFMKKATNFEIIQINNLVV